jgi:plastin-1
MVDAKKEVYHIPFMYKKLMTIEEQHQVIRSFRNFDKSGDGNVDSNEFKALLKDMGREDVTDDQITKMFEKYDKDKNGVLSFEEYILMAIEIGEGRRHFGEQHSKHGDAAKLEGMDGAVHSYKFEERNTIARLFNAALAKDEYVGDRFPIDPEGDDLWHVMYDGMVLIRALCAVDKDAVDMRTVNMGKKGIVNTFETHQNIDLGLAAAKGKIKLVGIDASAFLEKKPHLLLGVCFQLARMLALNKISLNDCPELYRLLEEGEEIGDLLKMPPEHILIRWVNYHCRAAGHPEKQIKNLGGDLKNSEAIFYVLNQLDKDKCPLDHIGEPDETKRAQEMINNSNAMEVPEVVDAKDWVKGNPKVNVVYVAEIFNTKHGLEELNEEEKEELAKAGIDEEGSGDREERQYKLWINSLEIPDCTVTNLYEDVRDGQILLKVIHKVNPNVVDWSKVKEKTKNIYEVGNNCNEAFEAMKKMNLKLIGLGPKDVMDGNKKNVLAFVWQLMREHYKQIIGNKTDADILAWGNGVPANADRQIKGFKDANLKDGVYLINLCAAIEPRIIDWELVYQQDDSTDEQKSLNARYAISIARKLGAIIFMVWEDVLEGNAKMMTIFMCTLFELY